MTNDSAPDPGTPAETPVLRRAPTQRRSRERVERILSTATELIAEKGSEGMRMSELAAEAGISIGSLYQYFPDKASIVRTLAERFNAEGRRCVEALLADVGDAESLRRALDQVVDGYYAMFRAEPVMRDIWSGVQADKDLQELDEADLQAHAAMLSQALAKVRPAMDDEDRERTAVLIMHLICSTVRLAITRDDREGEALVAAFKRTALQHVLTD